MWNLLLFPFKLLFWLLTLPIKLLFTIFAGVWAVIMFIVGIVLLVPIIIFLGVLPAIALWILGTLLLAALSGRKPI